MPGIIGFTVNLNPHFAEQQAAPTLARLQQSVTHGASYKQDPLYLDPQIAATRSHVGLVNDDSQPATFEGLRVWLDGEIVNRDELARQVLSVEDCASDADLLARLFRTSESFDFLRQIDGIYSAVVYDAQQRVVHFVTDRYGLQFLYYTELAEGIAWASETKAFLELPGFDPRLDEDGVGEFLKWGYLWEDRTWFSNAKLFPSGCVWTWQLDQRRWEKHRYWDWSVIRPLEGRIDPEEVAEELAQRFRKAVLARDDRPQHRVGVLLSGGLDSRAILATMPDRDDPIPAVTFGIEHSPEVQIAAQVARVKRANHTIAPMDKQNWLDNRVNAVWWLDGHFEIRHMHYMTALDVVRSRFDVNQSGFLGDATIGGSYLKIPSHDEFTLLSNRGRRFIGYGMHQGKLFGHERAPFYDNDFLELTMSIPAKYRKDSWIYCRMLRHLLPDEYHGIVWLSTGRTIRDSYPVSKAWEVWHKVARRGRMKLGLPVPNKTASDYGRWLNGPLGRKLVQDTLLADNRLFSTLPDLMSRVESTARKDRYEQGDVVQLCRAATLALWLQMVHHKDRRPAVVD